MPLSTPFGQRHFSPPADVPEYESENQIDMDIYSGDTNTKRIAAYKKLADAYLIQEGIVRGIFNAGAEWAFEQSAPKWISVEERLPERYDGYPLTRNCLVFNNKEYLIGFFSYSHSQWELADGCDEIIGVTHWQPLPQPPQK